MVVKATNGSYLGDTATATTFGRRSRQILEQTDRVGASFFADFIVGPFSFLPAIHDSRFDQNLHVIRQARLPQFQLLQQNTGSLLA